MDTNSKNGANPLNSENPLKTGNFNKIVLYVFLFMLVGIFTATAIIKLDFGGSFGRAPSSPASDRSTH